MELGSPITLECSLTLTNGLVKDATAEEVVKDDELPGGKECL